MLLKRAFILAIAVFISFISAGSARAQLGTSGIKGTVYDLTGALVSGASISVKNKSTSQTRDAISSEDGFFSVQNLQPGEYEIEIEAGGFDKIAINRVFVSVGETITVIGRLKPATREELVEVGSGEASPVNTSNAEISGIISEIQISNLPINGRNFLELGLLLPGNLPAPIFSPVKSYLSQISSTGQSARGNGVFVDGADNNEDVVGGVLQNFPIDSVREFQIAVGQYGAESGRSNSSIINIVTKIGTNEFHGSGAIFFRNDELSALPPTLDRGILARLGEPPFDRKQYAGTFGGPLKIDRAWFFNAFEYRDQDGILIAGERDLRNRTINTIYTPAPLRDLLFTTRVDLQVDNNDRMFFRYALQRENNIGLGSNIRPLATPNFRVRFFNNSQAFAYNWTHIFSSKLLNDFTFNESYYTSKTPIFSNLTANLRFPSIDDGSAVDSVPNSERQNRVQFRDNISLIAGAHVMKFGGEFHQISTKLFDDTFSGGLILLRENFGSIDRNRDGRIDDNDIPILFTVRVINTPETKTIDDNNNKYVSLFFQDSWRIKPNFTLNLGLRYELDTNATGRSSFDELNSIARAFVPKRPNIDNNNFAPRVGFSWDPFGDAKTSIRGGYGIYYSRILLQLPAFTRITSGGAIAQIRLGSRLDSSGRFIPGSPTLDNNPFSGRILENESSELSVIDPELSTPYLQQFSFGIERQLPHNIVLSVDGLHTFGLKFIQRQLINENPTVFSNVSSLKNWYDGLLIKLEKRNSRRFNFLASYTFSKALTMSQDFQVIGTENPNVKVDKGPPPNDTRHRFSFLGVYDAPLGIQISSILTASSTLPLDIRLPVGVRLPIAQVNAGSRQFKNGRELNEFIRQINSGGGFEGQPLPFVDDNLDLGDKLFSFDLRLSKTFRVKERLSVQAIAEVFNLFNITNIRGSLNRNFSGIQNVLVRDSEDEMSPGFMRSSTFGAKVENAGGVFGTGGPRAFQLALKVSF
jgi:hypothetical protein